MSLIHLLAKIWHVRKAALLSPDEIQALQEARFKKLLHHVLKNSRFYRDYYGDHGITMEKADRVSLSDLPVINKKIMMEHYDDVVCDPALKREEIEAFISNPENQRKKYKGRYQVIHTSGSTGRVGIFVYGPDDWDWLKAIVLTRVSKSKIRPFKKTRLAFIGATDGHYAGVSLATDAPRWLFDILELSINRPLEEWVQKLQDFQPNVLSGYASGMQILASLQKKGYITIRPERILCSADPLFPQIRKSVREAFGVDPVNFYAASESVGMAAECDVHDGLHLFTDWHAFEVTNADYKSVPAGQPGKLVLTNLYNYTQPLLRYEMNDEVIESTDPCTCGWQFPRIQSVAGRQEDFLWFEKPNGSKEFIHPSMIVEFFVPGLQKLQIVQTGPASFVMNAVISGDERETTPLILKRMDEILRGKGLEGIVRYEIKPVPDIPNDPKTGKFRLIIPFKP